MNTASGPDCAGPELIKLLESAVTHNASDIHLVVGRSPTIRVHGNLLPLKLPDLTTAMVGELSRQICALRADLSAELSQKGAVDFSVGLTVAGADRIFRGNICRERRGDNITLRLLSSKIPSPDEIGISASVRSAARSEKGLFLVIGATGSGKSTSLASLIQWLAKTSALKIVTAEQPVEYQFDHGKSVVVQREVPIHTPSFGDALRSMLRQDPDVIMVGELRELDEIRVALKAAETGHVVFATLHSNSASEAVNRLVEVFPHEEQQLIRVMLSTSLIAVMAQTLVWRRDKSGRVLAYEFLVNTDAVANMIRKGETQRIPSVVQTGSKAGMQTLERHLAALVRAGAVARDEALLHARNARELEGLLNKQQQEDEDE